MIFYLMHVLIASFKTNPTLTFYSFVLCPCISNFQQDDFLISTDSQRMHYPCVFYEIHFDEIMVTLTSFKNYYTKTVFVIM